MTRAHLIVVAIVSVLVVAGCSDTRNGAAAEDGPASLPAENASEATAQGYLGIAQAKASTLVDDARLASVGATGDFRGEAPDAWDYSFFSESGESVIMIRVVDKIAEDPVGTSNPDVSKEPTIDTADWEIDSTEAFDAASDWYRSIHAEEPPPFVSMLLLFTRAEAPGMAPLEPLVWHVEFVSDPETGASSAVEIDARTGDILTVSPT